ncbi:hypothetical protein EON63_21710 [archaeon]|nr:MAG: hypothetical protein EON63_21710 [archaeon]
MRYPREVRESPMLQRVALLPRMMAQVKVVPLKSVSIDASVEGGCYKHISMHHAHSTAVHRHIHTHSTNTPKPIISIHIYIPHTYIHTHKPYP